MSGAADGGKKKTLTDWNSPIKFHQGGRGRLFHAETAEEKMMLEREESVSDANDMALFASSLNGEVLTGKLTGRYRSPDGSRYQAVVTFVSPITDEEYYIHIEPEDFVTYRSRMSVEHIERFIESRLGSEVDFVIVEKIDEKTGLPFSLKAQMEVGRFFGSRVTAAEILRKRYWFAENTVGRKTEDYMYPGKICLAKVLYVARTTLVVEISGAEAPIPTSETGWLEEPDLRALYSPGDKVKVMLVEIRRSEERHMVGYFASMKRCMPDPRERAIANITRGMELTGRVVRIGEDRKSDGSLRAYAIVRCSKNLQVRCDLHAARIAVNDTVRIAINGVDIERLRVFGDILRVNRDYIKI